MTTPKHQSRDMVPLAWIPVSLATAHWVLGWSSLASIVHLHPWINTLALTAAAILVTYMVAWRHIKVPLMFMYACFFKPLGEHTTLQSRLESFYCDQAHIYDDSRGRLLRGRKTMLELCAAQLKKQIASGDSSEKPIWIDLGGGTGWNIEQMHASFGIENFEKVILIDLTPSLCNVARARFAKRGWHHVEVLCQDAATFQTPEVLDGRVSLVTMSYSLSMMDHYYPVVDRIQSLLSPSGIVGAVDFYVSGRSRAPVEQRSPQLDRQCNWFTRTFWQIWFDFDHIQLGPGRRDYLEYKFGTLKSLSCRNHFVIPHLIQIPYYIWLGYPRADARPQEDDTSSSGSTAGSDTSSITSHQDPMSLSCTSLVSTLSQSWRLDYDPTLPCHTQFRSYIYAFTWEDPRVDLAYLNLHKEDVMFVITSAGDNALEYAIHAQPKRIHCVDVNPCQNHLLELKLASVCALPYKEFWRLFGDGRHPHFASLLNDLISPHLSSYAFQYWSQNADRFAQKFYKTGYSGLALTVFEWWVRMQGLKGEVAALATAETLEEQERIWQEKIRPAIFSPMAQKLFSNPMFMWNALGVPKNQMNLFLKECTTLEYIENTLDPIPSHALLRNEQYFYYLCAMQRYSRKSCPSYLTPEGFQALRAPGVLDAFRLHTDSIVNVLASLPDDYLTHLVVMDHMDWFDSDNCDELHKEIQHMIRTLQSGGSVFWRSASTKPWYIGLFEKYGFTVKALAIRQPGQAIDRVNMYASFYVAHKQ